MLGTPEKSLKNIWAAMETKQGLYRWKFFPIRSVVNNLVSGRNLRNHFGIVSNLFVRGGNNPHAQDLVKVVFLITIAQRYKLYCFILPESHVFGGSGNIKKSLTLKTP